jgi:hypothetical protein
MGGLSFPQQSQPSWDSFMPGMNPGAGSSGFDPSSLLSYGQDQSAMGFIPQQSIQNLPLSSTTTQGNLPLNKFGTIPSLQLGLSGLQTVANIWNMINANKLATDQLNYTKQVGNANLGNSIKSYNTQLTDRANMDASVGGWDSAKMASYVNDNQLPPTTLK